MQLGSLSDRKGKHEVFLLLVNRIKDSISKSWMISGPQNGCLKRVGGERRFDNVCTVPLLCNEKKIELR